MFYKKLTIFSLFLLGTNIIATYQSMQEFFDQNYKQLHDLIKNEILFEEVEYRLEEFIKNGGDINEFFVHPSDSETNLTLCMYAGQNGAVDFIKYLLLKGANPLLKNNKEKTVFSYINFELIYLFYMPCYDMDQFIYRQVEIFELLLDAINIEEHKDILKDWFLAIKYLDISQVLVSSFVDPVTELPANFASKELIEDLVIVIEKNRNHNKTQFLIKELEKIFEIELLNLGVDEFIVTIKEIFTEKCKVNILLEMLQVSQSLQLKEGLAENYLLLGIKEDALFLSSNIAAFIPSLLINRPKSCCKILDYFMQALDFNEKEIIKRKICLYIKKLKDILSEVDNQAEIEHVLDTILEKLA